MQFIDKALLAGLVLAPLSFATLEIHGSAPVATGLAEVRLEGEISGEEDGRPSTFGILTDAGEVSAKMTPSKRKLEVLDELRAGLAAQGLQTWVDYDRSAIFVYLDKRVTSRIGAGCTDRTSSSVCTVIAQ
jgi:hypothetical protein